MVVLLASVLSAVCSTVSGQQLVATIADGELSVLAFSSDDALLACLRHGDGQSFLVVWDLAAEKELGRLPLASSVPAAVFARQDSVVLAHQPESGGVVSWDFRTGDSRLVAESSGNASRHAVMSSVFSADLRHVASSEVVRWPKSVVRVQRVDDASLVAEYESGGVVRELALSRDGATLSATDEQYDRRTKRFELHVLQWDLPGNEKPKRFGPLPMTGTHGRTSDNDRGFYCLSDDGRLLATTLFGNGVLVIDVASGQTKQVGPHVTPFTLEQWPTLGVFGNVPGTVISALAFTPGGACLATAAYGSNDVCFWSAGAPSGRGAIAQPDAERIVAIRFSSSGKRMAVTARQDRRPKTMIWQMGE